MVNLQKAISAELRASLKSRYDYAIYGFINEGYILVKRKGLWGFTDENGVEVLTPTYHNIERFIGNFAIVMLFGKFGIINRKGELVVRPKYSNFLEFQHNGYSKVIRDGIAGFVDMNGNEWGFPQIQN